MTGQAAVGGVEGPLMKLGHWLPLLMKPAALLSRSAAAVHSASAVTPTPAGAGRSVWPWQRTAPSHPALDEARSAFVQALDDIDSREAACLTMRIRYAPTLQALWHFRTEVFLLVSLHHSQHEARLRLERLSRHFPTRSPRSGFGALLD